MHSQWRLLFTESSVRHLDKSVRARLCHQPELQQPKQALLRYKLIQLRRMHIRLAVCRCMRSLNEHLRWMLRKRPVPGKQYKLCCQLWQQCLQELCSKLLFYNSLSWFMQPMPKGNACMQRDRSFTVSLCRMFNEWHLRWQWGVQGMRLRYSRTYPGGIIQCGTSVCIYAKGLQGVHKWCRTDNCI